MARTSDPHSATAQFFINVKNNDFLNYPGQDGWGYTVFGKVVSGMDVVMKIAKTPTGPNDVPRQPIVIESMTLVTQTEVECRPSSSPTCTSPRSGRRRTSASSSFSKARRAPPARCTSSATSSSTGSATTTSACRSTR